MSPDILISSLCFFSLLVAIFALSVAIWAAIKVGAIANATHSVQYVPSNFSLTPSRSTGESKISSLDKAGENPAKEQLDLLEKMIAAQVPTFEL